MFEKIFSFFNSSNNTVVDNRVNEYFDNQQWSALFHLLENENHIKLSNNQLDVISNHFVEEIKNNEFNGTFGAFFLKGSQNLNPKHFLMLTEIKIDKPLEQYLLKEYLKKYSNFNTFENYMDKVHPYEIFSKFLINNLNSSSSNSLIIDKFSKYLKSGQCSDNDLLIFSLLSPTLAQHFSFNDLKENPNISPKIIRNIFLQIKNKAPLIHTNDNVQTVNKKEITIDLNTIHSFDIDNNLKNQLTGIVTKYNKIKAINYNIDGEDMFFIKNILSNYLPNSLEQYLKIHKDYRMVKLGDNKSNANDIFQETLSLYDKRLDKIQDNILVEFKKRMNVQNKFIKKLGDNLNHYQNGTYELIDDAPFEAPPINIVKLTDTLPNKKNKP